MLVGFDASPYRVCFCQVTEEGSVLSLPIPASVRGKGSRRKLPLK